MEENYLLLFFKTWKEYFYHYWPKFCVNLDRKILSVYCVREYLSNKKVRKRHIPLNQFFYILDWIRLDEEKVV